MDFDILPLLMVMAGGVMLYGAVNNKNPIDVIKLVMQGKDPNLAPPLGVEVIVGTPHADPGEMHSDGTPRLFPNGTPRYTDDPRPQELLPTDPRNTFKAVPPAGSPGDPRAPKDTTRPIGFTPGANLSGGAWI